MKKILFILLVIWGQKLSAQSISSEYLLHTEQTGQKLLEEISGLKALNPEDYIEKLKIIRASTEKYLQDRINECSGEFSTIEINPQGMSQSVKKTLNAEEKKLCLTQVRKFQEKYIYLLFDTRKKFLEKLQQIQLSTLDDSRKKTLEGMSKSIPSANNKLPKL